MDSCIFSACQENRAFPSSLGRVVLYLGLCTVTSGLLSTGTLPALRWLVMSVRPLAMVVNFHQPSDPNSTKFIFFPFWKLELHHPLYLTKARVSAGLVPSRSSEGRIPALASPANTALSRSPLMALPIFKSPIVFIKSNNTLKIQSLQHIHSPLKKFKISFKG